MAKSISYKSAGVDIDKADSLIRKSRKLIDSTRVRGSMDSVGGFGGFFDLKKTGLKDPLLVSSTDGVGTKLKIAFLAGKHDTVGVDLVAMCVNDILCSGAKPLFFLDYFATGRLRDKVWTSVLKGIVKACRESGCALLGGETAEMPGMYPEGEYDLAGFSVGIVERKNIVDGRTIKPGDVILGLAPSGLHSNGYSLVRKIFSRRELKDNAGLFLKPTRLYVKPVLALLDAVEIKGIANITGGGFYDNIPRVLPRDCSVVIEEGTWRTPEVFKLVERKGVLREKEKYRTLNMGIGMVSVMSLKEAEKARKILKKRFKLSSWIIGEVVKGDGKIEIT